MIVSIIRDQMSRAKSLHNSLRPSSSVSGIANGFVPSAHKQHMTIKTISDRAPLECALGPCQCYHKMYEIVHSLLFLGWVLPPPQQGFGTNPQYTPPKIQDPDMRLQCVSYVSDS